MPDKLKLKLAKRHDTKGIVKLFSLIGRKISHKKVSKYIENKKVYILKDKKKVRAAFCFTLIGIGGIFAIMYINKIAVAPEFHGQGIGTFLLSRIRKISIKLGASAFFLYSIEKAKKFYEKNKLKKVWRIFWFRSKKA